MLDEGLLGVGVNPRVDRLVADRAVSVRGSIHGRQCATRFGVQAPADLARCVPLEQISNHATAQDLITIQEPLLRAAPGCVGGFASFLDPIHPVRARMARDLTRTPPKGYVQSNERHTPGTNPPPALPPPQNILYFDESNHI